MALAISGQECELREVVLRDKPPEFLEVSPSATVPALVSTDGVVLDESLDIMLWALKRNDPESWLTPDAGDMAEMLALIDTIDGPFKKHLDSYKYATRHAAEDPEAFAIENREEGMRHLADLDERLQIQPFLFGGKLSLADVATAPFVRQFANTDLEWFSAQPHSALHTWLDRFVTSELFLSVMKKYPQWQSGTVGDKFPQQLAA